VLLSSFKGAGRRRLILFCSQFRVIRMGLKQCVEGIR